MNVSNPPPELGPNPEHLKLIQGVIDRMARNSFLLKGWSVTLAAALLGFSVRSSQSLIAVIAALVSTDLAFLDAKYLSLERQFRHLYEDACRGEAQPWALSPPDASRGAIWRALKSPSVYMVHGAVIGLALLVAVLG